MHEDEKLMKLIIEIDLTQGCKHKAYHLFGLNVAGSDYYKSATSFNAFFHGQTSSKAKYQDRNRNKTRLFSEHDFDFADMYMNDDTPCVNHKTIWDFYKYIGYDYKTKKYN